jgi:hypothetical protein
MRILWWIAIALVIAIVGIALVFIGARFGDGPVGMIPGGPLRSGELVAESDVDWTFVSDEPTIELQLVDPLRSRTVWLVVHDRQAYVPCSLGFPPFKTWHQEALEDGRSVLRVEGKRYERQLVRVTDEAQIAELAAVLANKYGLEEGGFADPSRLWFFHVASRDHAALRDGGG